MHRCKSFTSLLEMHQKYKGFDKAIPYNPGFYGNPFPPYETLSDDPYGIESQDPDFINIPDAQPLPPDARGPNYYCQESSTSDSETYSEYPEPVTQTDPTEQTIHLTDIKNCRETLATLSNFNGGQIGQHLKKDKGLLILPLHAVSILRLPHGSHVGNYPVLIYFPKEDLKNYPHLSNFNEAINAIYN